MMRLIDADALEKYIFDSWGGDPAEWTDMKGWDPARADVCMLKRLRDAPTVDVVPVVRCKDCKHRPIITPGRYINRFDIEFPDDTCPCDCDDPFYRWYPADDFFCAKGEHKEV